MGEVAEWEFLEKVDLPQEVLAVLPPVALKIGTKTCQNEDCALHLLLFCANILLTIDNFLAK